MKIKLLALAALVGLSLNTPVHASDRDRYNAILADYKANPPTCSGDEDCKVKWQVAQAFVARNSGLMINVVSDAIIQTHPSSSGSSSMQFTIWREPLPDGSYRFMINANCGMDDIKNCDINPWDALPKFRDAIMSKDPTK